MPSPSRVHDAAKDLEVANVNPVLGLLFNLPRKNFLLLFDDTSVKTNIGQRVSTSIQCIQPYNTRHFLPVSMAQVDVRNKLRAGLELHALGLAMFVYQCVFET